MTRITIELDDSVYHSLEEAARVQHRTPEDVARDLIAEMSRIRVPTTETVRSVRQMPTLSLGKMLRPVGNHGEIFEEMLSGQDE